MEQRKIEHITLHLIVFGTIAIIGFSPPDRTTLWLGRVQQLPYFGGMLHYYGGNLSQSANGIQATSFSHNRKMLYEI